MKLIILSAAIVLAMAVTASAQCANGVCQVPAQQFPQQIMVPRVQYVPHQLQGTQYRPPAVRPIWRPLIRVRQAIIYRPGYWVPQYAPMQQGAMQ